MAISPIMPTKARVALLMATRDQGDLLYHALSSLLSQSHEQLSLTVVDDGSSDHTPEILARFSHDPRLKVISTRPQGPIPSLNLAMQKSKPAAIYAVVYASCFYAYNFLESMVSQLLRQPKASGIFCSAVEGTAQRIQAIFEEPRYDDNELLVRNCLGPGVIFRAEAFKAAGGLFLSEKRGIWETWQRLALQGPFVRAKHAMVRQSMHPYDQPPPAPALDPELLVYPHLKLRVQVLGGDNVDADWLQLLSDHGHSVGTIEQLKDPPQLVICGSPQTLRLALNQAYEHYAPVALVINEIEIVEEILAQPRLRLLLGSCTFVTRTVKVAQALNQANHQALVYMHGMTKRELNRLLTRIPMLLWRNRSVVLIRAYGSPNLLERTLESLRGLNRPPDFGDLLIYCIDRHPELLRWLSRQSFSWQAATQNAYFPELLALMRQMRASYVLSVDSGTLLANDFFTRLWPLLADPIVGMASGHLNLGPAIQNLPFNAPTPGELAKQWPKYQPQRAIDHSPQLSDSAFLMRKSVFEWLLATYPELLPLSDETQMARLLTNAGYSNLLCRQTVAFNLLQTL